VECELDSTGSGQGPMANCCECGDEPSDISTKELVFGVVSQVRTNGRRHFK
jgi:hypothetical protein